MVRTFSIKIKKNFFPDIFFFSISNSSFFKYLFEIEEEPSKLFLTSLLLDLELDSIDKVQFITTVLKQSSRFSFYLFGKNHRYEWIVVMWCIDGGFMRIIKCFCDGVGYYFFRGILVRCHIFVFCSEIFRVDRGLIHV
jgi:hypothetical protein